MKYLSKTTYLLFFLVFCVSCGEEKKEDFVAKITAQSCVDFRILLSQFSSNLLVPLNVNLKSKEEWGEFCSCVGSVFEKEFINYKDAKLESLLKFDEERKEVVKDILQKHKEEIVLCYNEQKYQEVRLIKKYLENLNEKK